MFMFVFAVILISLVGLFFQVVSALGLYLNEQQLGMGQQLLSWHSMAVEYACSATLPEPPPLTSDPRYDTGASPNQATPNPNPAALGIRSQHSEYRGRYWSSAIFTDPATGQLLVLSYIPSTSSFSGLSKGEVARQFRSTVKGRGNDYDFGPVYSGPSGTKLIDMIVNDVSTRVAITFTIPSYVSVPVNALGIVTSVQCP